MGYVIEEETQCKSCGRIIRKNELQYDSPEGRTCLACCMRIHEETRVRMQRVSAQRSAYIWRIVQLVFGIIFVFIATIGAYALKSGQLGAFGISIIIFLIIVYVYMRLGGGA